MSVMKMDTTANSPQPVTPNSLDNSLRIVVHPTPSVDLATIVESTSNGLYLLLDRFIIMYLELDKFYYFNFSDEAQQNIENNKKNSNCFEEEFLPALGRVKPSFRRSSVTSLVHTLQSMQMDSSNNKVLNLYSLKPKNF